MFEQEDRADKILREYVRERMRDFNPPGTPELWERFAKTRLQQRRGFNRAWPAVCYAAAVAALLLVVTGVSFLAVPEQVRAVGQKIVVV
ncbi:MAG: hypothetical protein IBX71_09380, partial [Candidatus Desulforudis sp.]|nr:hypothetical protein [Desulforudis sp.]